MKRNLKIIASIAMLFLFLFMFTACGLISTNDEKPFDTFTLTISGAQNRYLPTETATIIISENQGSPTGYNVYDKFNDGSYIKRGKTSLNKSIAVTFTELGTYYIKVVPVVDTLEQASKALEVSFLVVADKTVPLEDFQVKQNIIDLYYGTNEDSFKISDLQIVYSPLDTTDRNLVFARAENDNIQILGETTIKATGYTAGQEPYLLKLYNQNDNSISKNVYFRINNSKNKSTTTKIYAGYVDKNYYNGDWISFQCFAYAGMLEPSAYAVYRKEGEVLSPVTVNSGDLKVETEQGMIFHKVKVTEPEGRVNLRFYAIIGGVESTVYTDVSVLLAEPTVVATSLTLNESEKTLLLDQSFTVQHSILPMDTYDKTVRYEVEEGYEDYLTISATGKITPAENFSSLPDLTKVIKIRVVSNSKESVYAEIDLTIIKLYEADIKINITAADFDGENPLTQSIEHLCDITFEIQDLNDYSSKWYVGGAAQSATSSTFVLVFMDIETAGNRQVRVEITLDDSFSIPVTIAREFTVTLESVFDIAPLLEKYPQTGEIELEYTTELSETSVLWSLYTATGSKVKDIAGNTYSFEEAGNYKFCATLSHNGIPIEEKFSTVINVVDSLTHELYNVYVNGYKEGTNYAPIIKWLKLGEGTEFTIDIRKGSQSSLYESTNPAYSAYFTSDSFRLPHTDFALSDSFDYRIKTNISNTFTGFYSYKGTIESDQYSYLQDVNGVMNRYILNVYDLGKLLNYIQVFRPSAFFESESEGKFTYRIDVYFAIDYETDVDKAAYGGDIEPNMPSGTSEVILNASKLITAASLAYGVGNGISMSYEEISNGGIKLKLTLLEEDDITGIASGGDEIENVIIYNQSYSDKPRGALNTDFPIDSITKTIAVSSSNELFLAASWGIKPLPTVGSAAERIYGEAKAILNSILDDSMSDIEKANAIYDYLCSEIVYDKALYDNYLNQIYEAISGEEQNEINKAMHNYKSFHLEGVFNEKVAVCDGISKAFVLLCAIEDITAMKVGGVAGSEQETAVNHAWNMIMLGGKWFYVDATWGRSKLYHKESDKYYIGVNHYYINATSEIEATHHQQGEIPIVADEREYYFYAEIGEDLYFDTENELNAFMNALLLRINEATGGMYVDFAVGYIYEDSLYDYIAGKLPNGAYMHSITPKDNIVGIFIIISE